MKTLTIPHFSRRCLLIPAVALVSATAGNAALLSAVSATSNMGSAYNSTLASTIDGSGLSSLSLTAVHDATQPDNSWISEDGQLVGEIVFDLGGLQMIDGFSFWNQNGGGPAEDGKNGIRQVSIRSSIDGKIYSLITGAPEIFDQSKAPASDPQRFSFAAVDAQYVKFTVIGNYGDSTNTGFAEIQFRTASVPDAGSTLALLGITLLGLGAMKRKIP